MRLSSILIPIIVVLGLLGLAVLPTGYAQPVGGSVGQYLPLVFKPFPPTTTIAPTNTPVSSATPSPTVISIVRPLVNGDFEQGDQEWDTFGNQDIITSSLSILPHGGSFVARFRVPQGSSDAPHLKRTIVVPQDAPFLRYWIYIDGMDGCGINSISIGVYDPNDVNSLRFNGYTICAPRSYPEWSQFTFDLREFAGQSLTFFIDSNISIGGSTVYFDDITWRSTR